MSQGVPVASERRCGCWDMQGGAEWFLSAAALHPSGCSTHLSLTLMVVLLPFIAGLRRSSCRPAAYRRSSGLQRVHRCNMSAGEDCVAAALALIAATDSLPGTDLPVEDTRSLNASAWSSFCQRVEQRRVKPTCVIDFAYSDGGALKGDARSAPCRQWCRCILAVALSLLSIAPMAGTSPSVGGPEISLAAQLELTC